MGLAVLPPDPEEGATEQTHFQDGSYGEDESDTSMQADDSRPSKRRRLSSSSSRQIALPGEIITDDTQWMRWVRLSRNVPES